MIELNINTEESIRKSMVSLLESLNYRDIAVHEKFQYHSGWGEDATMADGSHHKFFEETEDGIGRIVEQTLYSLDCWDSYSCCTSYEYIIKHLVELFCTLSMIQWGAYLENETWYPKWMRPLCYDQTMLEVLYEGLFPDRNLRNAVALETEIAPWGEEFKWEVYLLTQEERALMLEVVVETVRTIDDVYRSSQKLDYESCSRVLLETIHKHSRWREYPMSGRVRYYESLLQLRETTPSEKTPEAEDRQSSKKGRPKATSVLHLLAVYDRMKEELQGKEAQEQKQILERYVSEGILKEVPAWPALKEAELISCAKSTWYSLS